MTLTAVNTVLTTPEWQARREAHERRVEEIIGDYLRARRRGHKHPVLDFLFTYYSSRPSHVTRWHPGFGVTLQIDDTHTGRDRAREYLGLRGYHRVPDGVTVDPAYLRQRARAVESADTLLARTAARPARMGCFGLHEWAMVYRTDDTRHAYPLRLGATGTDAVVESMPLRCTHFDAFRFFTDAARPRNEISLTPSDRLERDQPGCLHATMDLYRTCFTLAPLLDARLTVSAFEIARDARELDMRASPYDLSALGYEPVLIETPAGRAAYVREQTGIAARGAALRADIGAALGQLRSVIAAGQRRAGGEVPGE
ncbi:3-methyladenine DNA glycosylase [Gordonia sp. VNQ95]|jgi:hypothetical protein|uniref:3-methyladenine DNA glycosylase n=1 Tax=Gordonia TaxID=2053 RepID=UPI0032B56A18